MNKHIFHYFALVIQAFLLPVHTSAQQQKSEKQLEAMLLLNQQSTENPTYVVPCATANFNLFATAVFSAGEAIESPLSYFTTAAPGLGYQNFSRSAFVAGKGQSMQLALITNKNTGITAAYAYAFADWNRDGIFESNIGKHSITNIATSDAPGIRINISVPDTAKTGKTRIRIFLTTANVTGYNPNASLTSGYIHDFVIFVTPPVFTPGLTLINSAPNNPSWGSTLIESSTLPVNGRYPTGSSITFKAVRQGAVEFLGWSDGSTIISTQPQYTTTADQSMYLVGIFKSATATLEAPQTSSAQQPIWYQIKNAQTDTRLNRFLAYSATIPAGYTTALRIEKPEDFSDRFLWRLEPGTNGMVKLINKGTNLQLVADGTLNVSLNVQETGSEFKAEPSGNANGSYSIKYNNNAAQLLNGGLSFNVVLYNAGVGTGSGWYFYRIPNALTSTKQPSANQPSVYFSNTDLNVTGAETGSTVTIYNVSGHAIHRFKTTSEEHREPFTQKGIFIIFILHTDNTHFISKLIN